MGSCHSIQWVTGQYTRFVIPSLYNHSIARWNPHCRSQSWPPSGNQQVPCVIRNIRPVLTDPMMRVTCCVEDVIISYILIVNLIIEDNKLWLRYLGQHWFRYWFAPVQCRPIVWTKADLFSFRPLGRNTLRYFHAYNLSNLLNKQSSCRLFEIPWR